MFELLCGLVLIGSVVGSPAPQIKQEVRIVGGEDIDITLAPYQVSVLNRGRHSCGGAIIAPDLVVTAAHCVMGGRPTDFQVRAGSSSHQSGGQIIPVGDLVWHQYFTYSKMDNDIALLWLSKPLEFSDRIAAVDVMNSGEEINDGEVTIVTGWGHTREGGGTPTTLQQVFVPTVNSQSCNDAYAPFYSITPRMLCAGIPEGGKDACQGDSGGPLVHNGKLAGIVSWGMGCARPKFPGVYSKVSALRDWVDEHSAFLRMKHVMRPL